MRALFGRRCTTGIAGIVALAVALLAVCPCPPASAAETPEDPHGCCAGKAGLAVGPDAGSCCSDHARDVQVVAAPPLALADGWTGTVTTIAAVPSRPAAPLPAAPFAAPVVLRI